MSQDYGWSGTDTELLVMEDGWTRVNSSDIGDARIHRIIEFNQPFHLQSRAWLAQANYIFNRIGITSNYDDYVFVNEIMYQLTLSDTGGIPPGYLFLCPLQDRQSDIPSHFRLPPCPAYWSLDPSGAERLSTEEAERLGFPSFELKMEGSGLSWDESVYTGVHQFHEGKGYDPYSQDVARELGYPLFQVASKLELFKETESCSGDENSEQDDGLLSHEVDRESGKDSSLVEGIHSRLDDAELLKPSRTWKIVMAVQFILILASTTGRPLVDLRNININKVYATCGVLAFGAEASARTAALRRSASGATWRSPPLQPSPPPPPSHSNASCTPITTDTTSLFDPCCHSASQPHTYRCFMSKGPFHVLYFSNATRRWLYSPAAVQLAAEYNPFRVRLGMPVRPRADGGTLNDTRRGRLLPREWWPASSDSFSLAHRAARADSRHMQGVAFTSAIGALAREGVSSSARHLRIGAAQRRQAMWRADGARLAKSGCGRGMRDGGGGDRLRARVTA
ncbi:hypothetical protein DFH09DRAFT_1397933 [Mycena vulgaris]|nr:hypothetical protein DFH09DRAFT_1397933 [Mycena vulgaris]